MAPELPSRGVKPRREETIEKRRSDRIVEDYEVMLFSILRILLPALDFEEEPNEPEPESALFKALLGRT